MRAFIVRPFNVREGIDFEAVERDYIRKAMDRAGITGGTTGVILEPGNIREDMFQQLLVCDLVIADVTLPNPNVYYELGIRHALQPRHTVLIRAKRDIPREQRRPEDQVPFDILTDRYLEYDPANLSEAAVSKLADTLSEAERSERDDSPVFRLLPNLQPQDRTRFLSVPLGFREDVELAGKQKKIGLLGLLSQEGRLFPWASEGLRFVGRTQFGAKDTRGATETFEALCGMDPLDVEANLRLGTTYQRQGRLDASDQVLNRVLTKRNLAASERAEADSLLARNFKDRWRAAWSAEPAGDARLRKALRSPYLQQACDRYTEGFHEDLNHFYPGLNALGLQTIMLELARLLPDVWTMKHNSPEEAAERLKAVNLRRERLVGAVWNTLEANRARLNRDRQEDRWVDLSCADYAFLTKKEPEKIAIEYENALAGAPPFFVASARAQLQLFGQLGLFPDRVEGALSVFPPDQAPEPAPARVILFTGHMIDEPGRTPRFPAGSEDRVRDAIRAAVQTEIDRTPGRIVAVASAANGADLLFHEACQDLGVEAKLMLPLPPDRFRTDSVAPAGPAWERRFDELLRRHPDPPHLSDEDSLPRWLTGVATYNSWQRANMWLIQEALAIGAGAFTVMAFWDGSGGDGPGGTEHLLRLAREYGAAEVVLPSDGICGTPPAGLRT